MRLGDIDERKLTGGEKRSKEAHFKKLKKHKKDFTDRYGDEGESIMHAIATKRAKGESVEEGYYELPPFDREKYQKRDGLEGPIPTRSGKVVYYDEKEGMYYDPDTDMYISYDDFRMLDKPSMHMVGKATSRHDDIRESEYTGKLHPSVDVTRDDEDLNFCYDCKLISNTIGEIDNDSDETDVVCPRCGSEAYVEASPEEIEKYSNVREAELKGFDVTSQRALRDLKQRYPHAKDPVSAMLADIEKNERDGDRVDDTHSSKIDDMEDRIAKLEKEIGMKENITPPGSSARQASMNVLNSLEYIVKNKSASEVKFFDGKAKVDLFTASAVLSLYNGVNDDNKKKLANLMADRQGFVKAAKIAFKMSENTEMKLDNLEENRLGFSDIEKFGKEMASKIDMEARRRGSADMKPGDADELRYKIAKEMGLVESKLNEGVLDDADEDGWMAKSQLYKLAKYAIGLHGMISDTDNLEPWIQAKITRASEDLSSVKHYMEYNEVNASPWDGPEQTPMAVGEDMHDVDEHKMLAKHLMDMAKEDDADEYGMDGDYFREVARAVMGHDPMEIRAAILDGDTSPREQVLDHIARKHPGLLKEIFPRDAEKEQYLATMREEEENHYLCVHAQKGSMKCTAGSSYEAAKKAAAQWKMKSTAGIDAHLMGDEPKTATEGHSPHKKGTAKYKKHMAAKHAGMNEGTAEQLEKQAIDFFTSIKSKINTTGKK